MRPLASVVAVLLLACADGGGEARPRCAPGEVTSCDCPGGGAGTRPCEGGVCRCPAPLAVEPAALDFGPVEPESWAERGFRLVNPGDVPVAIRRIALAPGADPAFAITTRTPPSVPARGAVLVAVSYAPETTGDHAATVVIEVGEAQTLTVPLAGRVPRGVLVCEPFPPPTVHAGATGEGRVVCRNAATEPGEAVVLEAFHLEGSEALAPRHDYRLPDGRLEPGSSFVVPVVYRPDEAGDHAATLRIRTRHETVSVPLEGHALPPLACSLAPGLPELRIPRGEAGTIRQLRLPLENLRADSGCRLQALRLDPPDPRFELHMQGEGWLRAGEKGHLLLSYRPDGADAETAVRFFPEGAMLERVIPVRAADGQACVRLDPDDVLLHARGLGCVSPGAEVRLTAVCPEPVELVETRIEGAPSFALLAAPAPAQVLDPGERALAVVSFEAGVIGLEDGSLVVETAGVAPAVAALRGKSTCEVFRTDRHTQADPPRACFELVEAPQDLDGDGAITGGAGELQVRVDELEVPETADDVRRWSHDAAGNQVCFEPDFVPPPGAQVKLHYPLCWCA